jgi:hypothetical protein
MRYEELELPQEPWSVRLSLGHLLTPQGESAIKDRITGRRPAGVDLPMWKHESSEPATTIRFPDHLIAEYANLRLVPLTSAFHSLASKITGAVLSHPSAPIAAPEGVSVGLVADLEVWAARQRPTEVDFWVELPSDHGSANVRLLCRYQADGNGFTRRVFSELIYPTELALDGSMVRQSLDEPSWSALREVAERFRHEIIEFLVSLPESE